MIICIEGPTASGKTAFALQLAESLNTEIINADSRQVYRKMDIGTAKPDPGELAAIPHHLIDIIDPNESYNAGAFVNDAEQAISIIKAKSQIPIVCGGTGLYIRSLLQGLFEHSPIDPELKQSLNRQMSIEGTQAMYDKLKKIDPDFAHGISNKDSQRILRGLEVFLGTGKPISEHWRQQKKQIRHQSFRILVDRPREELYTRIDHRVQCMLKAGMIDEIKMLLELGYTWQHPGLKTMGYIEFRPFFEGEAKVSDCGRLIAQHHRNYAKRQQTWNRKSRFDLTIYPQSFSLSDILREIQSLFMRFKEEYGEDHRQNRKS